MLPQVAQGALAVECRADDTETAATLAAIEDRDARRAVDAERAFLAELGGGCDLPVGALAAVDGSTVRLEVVLASLDGRVVLRARADGDEPGDVGRDAARRLLEDQGGRTLLEDVA